MRDAPRASRRRAATVNAGSSGSGPMCASSAARRVGSQQPRRRPGACDPTPSSAARGRTRTGRRAPAVFGRFAPTASRPADIRCTISVSPPSAVNSSRLARRPTAVKRCPGQRGQRRIDRLHGREVGDRHGRDRLCGESLALRDHERLEFGELRHILNATGRHAPLIVGRVGSASMSAPGTVTSYRNGFPESRHRVHAVAVRTDGTVIGACRRSRPPDHDALGRKAVPGAAAGRLGRARRARARRPRAGRRVRLARRPGHPRRGGPPRPARLRARRERAAQLARRRRRSACATTAPATTSGSWPSRLDHGWETEGYRAPEHPAQRAALAVMAEHSELDAAAIPTGTDGCGVVAFALPLRVIASMYARLAERLPRQSPAMRAHPRARRGDGDLDTEADAGDPRLRLQGRRRGALVHGPDRARGSASPCGSTTATPARARPPPWPCSAQLLSWDAVPAGLERSSEPVLREHGGRPPSYACSAGWSSA